MRIAFLPHQIDAIRRRTRTRSTVCGTVARLPSLTSAPPTVNAGRWATRAGEYASAWACPLDERLPAITTPGPTVAIACGDGVPVLLHLAGAWAGRVAFEGSDDGVVWRRIALVTFTDAVVEDEALRPGLWRVSPGQRIAHFRLHVVHLAYGAVLASVAAAPAFTQVISHSLDSAA